MKLGNVSRTCGLMIPLLMLVGCTSWQPPQEQFIDTEVDTRNRLHATYLGATSLVISDGKDTILFDGFFTRKSLFGLFTDKMVSDEGIVLDGLKRAGIYRKKVSALFIAHNHYDHAIDAFTVAKHTNTTIYAPPETLNLKDYAHEKTLVDNEEYVLGDFKVRALLTPHVEKSKLVKLTESVINWLSDGENYKHAPHAYSFLITHRNKQILIVPSANFKEVDQLEADIVFLGVGLLGSRPKIETQKLWQNAVEKTDASLVIPIHWDNITETIGNQIPPIPWYVDDLKKTMKRLNSYAEKSEGIQILYPPAFVKFVL